MATEVTNFPRETTQREIANALNVIAIAMASNAGELDSWDAVQQLVRQGLGPKAFPVGSRLQATHSLHGTVALDVVAHNHHKKPGNPDAPTMTLLMRDCIYGRAIDGTEALYYCETGLAAGVYNFTLLAGYDLDYGGGKTYQFTLANAVPAGGVLMFPWGYQVQASAIKVSSYASRTATTAIESVNVTEGSDGTSLGTANGLTPNMNHVHRIRYGSNNWAESAARQYFNSAAAANAWWQPKTIFDRPTSYTNVAGLLNGFDPAFVAALGPVDIITARNTVFEIGGTLGGSYITRDTLFCPSMTELGLGNNNSIAEGGVLAYYVGAGEADRIKYDIATPTTARYWWLRSPSPSSAISVRSIYPSGALNISNANLGYGLAAACVIY